MAFEKPLKVFLSYSHRDDPELFLEFRNHLTSLEDDGIIEVWDDRDITAGLNWDQEIKGSLKECHLFVALTSANFNASGYIRGIEMRTALDRHDAGLCRIIPVMWRDWRPPKTFDTLQFLNRNPVATADKRDEVLRALTSKIEVVVKEMTEGRWVPRQPALPAIDPSLAYLCDWTVPILQLNGLRQNAGTKRRPCVLILLGTRNDCADEFLRRTHRTDLPTALDFAAPVHDACVLDWPPSPDLASGFVHRCLGAQPDWEIERKLREGLTPVGTVTLGWDKAKENVLARMLHEWSEDSWVLPPNRCLLLAVTIVSSPWALGSSRPSAVRKSIATVAARRPEIPIRIINLPKIEREHALNWPDLPEVRVYRRDEATPLKDSIRQIYWWRRKLAMKRLAPRLLAVLQQNRRLGAKA